MALLREKYFFLVAFLFSGACFFLAAYLGLRRTDMEGDLDRHHFNRGAMIAVKMKSGAMSPADAMRLMNNPAKMSDGLLAVLSRATAAQLQALPEVEQVFPITKLDNNLTLASGFSSNVIVFNIPAAFVSAFGLGDPAILKKDVYVPSSILQRKMALTIASNSPFVNATLGPTYEGDSGPAKKSMANEDAAKYKVPVLVANTAFSLPGGSAAFDNTLFASGEPVKVDTPDVRTFYKVWLAVKLKEGVDADSAMQNLRNLVENGTDLYNEKNLTFTPMTQFFARELSLNYLENWAARLRLGVIVMSILLLLMLVLTRYARIQREVVLRQAMGAGALSAAWLSIRQTVMGILGGILVTSVLVFIICLLQKTLLPAILPMFGVMGLIGVAVFLLLLGGGMLAGRSEPMRLLKGAW